MIPTLTYTIVLDTESATVRYDPVAGYIYHTFHCAQTGEPFRDVMNRALDYLIEQQGTKWLSDDRNNDALTDEGNQWSATDWQPRTMKAGWKYWANVVPQDLAAAGTLLPIIEMRFEAGLRMAVFTEVDDAIAWLDTLEG